MGAGSIIAASDEDQVVQKLNLECQSIDGTSQHTRHRRPAWPVPEEFRMRGNMDANSSRTSKRGADWDVGEAKHGVSVIQAFLQGAFVARHPRQGRQDCRECRNCSGKDCHLWNVPLAPRNPWCVVQLGIVEMSQLVDCGELEKPSLAPLRFGMVGPTPTLPSPHSCQARLNTASNFCAANRGRGHFNRVFL